MTHVLVALVSFLVGAALGSYYNDYLTQKRQEVQRDLVDKLTGKDKKTGQ